MTKLEIEVAPQAKEYMQKVSTHLYFLRPLKRAKVPSKDLLLFYITCIRPVAEYAREVFHDSPKIPIRRP